MSPQLPISRAECWWGSAPCFIENVQDAKLGKCHSSWALWALWATPTITPWISTPPWLASLSTQCRTRLGDEAAQVPQEAVGFGCVEGFGQGATRKEPAVAFLMATAMGPWACLQSVETQHLKHQHLVALIALAPVLTRLWSSGPKNAACRCHRVLKALVYAYMNSLLDTYCQNHISTLPESTVRYAICKSSSNMANVSMPSFSIRLDAWDPLLVEPQELDITKDLVWSF